MLAGNPSTKKDSSVLHNDWNLLKIFRPLFYFPKNCLKDFFLSLVCFSLNNFMMFKLDAPCDPKKIRSNFNEQKSSSLKMFFTFKGRDRLSIFDEKSSRSNVCFSHGCDNDFYLTASFHASSDLLHISTFFYFVFFFLTCFNVDAQVADVSCFFCGGAINKDFISHKRHKLYWLWKERRRRK